MEYDDLEYFVIGGFVFLFGSWYIALVDTKDHVFVHTMIWLMANIMAMYVIYTIEVFKDARNSVESSV